MFNDLMNPHNIQHTGPFLSELLAVKAGLKPLCKGVIEENSFEIIKKICNKNKLFAEKSKFKMLLSKDERKKDFKVSPDSKLTNWILIYISKNKDYIERAHYLFKSRKWDSAKIGEFLGYPKCCILSYCDLSRKNINCTDSDRIKNSLKNSNRLSFYLNNFLWGTPYFLISHFPCSYECKKSIKYAKELLNVIRNENFDFSNELIKTLKYPILYFDKFNFAFFKGHVRNNKCSYNNFEIMKVRNVNFSINYNAFKYGNSFKVDKNNVYIFSDDSLIYVIEKPALLLNFGQKVN
jgi:hypothetical protein